MGRDGRGQGPRPGRADGDKEARLSIETGPVKFDSEIEVLDDGNLLVSFSYKDAAIRFGIDPDEAEKLGTRLVKHALAAKGVRNGQE